MPGSAIQLLRCSGAITGSQTRLLARSQMGRACWQPRCRQIILLLCTHSHCGMIRLMWVHVCCYCCINYSFAIFTSLWISLLSPRISYFLRAGLHVRGAASDGGHSVSHRRQLSHISRCLPTSIDQLLTRSSLHERAQLSRQHSRCAAVCGLGWKGQPEWKSTFTFALLNHDSPFPAEDVQQVLKYSFMYEF